MDRVSKNQCAAAILLFACAGYADAGVPFSQAVNDPTGGVRGGFIVPFAPPVVMPIGGVGGDVTTADVDADGDVDIIATTRDPSFCWVFINDGTGVFAPGAPYAAGDRSRAVIAADINDDGDVDLVTANQFDGSVSVLAGDGTGAFATRLDFLTFSTPMEVSAGDFNGNGLLDLAVTHKSNGVGTLIVLLNSGGVGAGWLGFGPPTGYAIGSGSRDVDTVDIDGDGDIDIVVTNRESGSISVFLGDGSGVFSPQIVFPVGVQPRDTVIGDFTCDGLPDLAVADFGTDDAWIIANLGVDGANDWLGLAPAVANPGGGMAPHGITAGDLDLDNDLDLLMVNVQSGNLALSVMLNDGAGGFANTAIEPVSSTSAASVSMADFDGDGDLDAVNSNARASGSISIHINLIDTCIGDFNTDGVVDTADLGLLLGFFGAIDSHIDLNGDGVVDTADLGILLGAFGDCQ